MTRDGVPPEVRAELDPLIARAVLAGRVRPRDRLRFAEAVSALWVHGAMYGARDVCARLGVPLPDDRTGA